MIARWRNHFGFDALRDFVHEAWNDRQPLTYVHRTRQSMSDEFDIAIGMAAAFPAPECPEFWQNLASVESITTLSEAEIWNRVPAAY